MRDFPLYHWSPSTNRASIRRVGLVPGRLSVDRQWRPPYVCFSDSPSFAWVLTAANRHIEQWDLWMMWSSRVPAWERLGGRGQDLDEYRIYHRIYKSSLWFVGTRNRSDPR